MNTVLVHGPWSFIFHSFIAFLAAATAVASVGTFLIGRRGRARDDQLHAGGMTTFDVLLSLGVFGFVASNQHPGVSPWSFLILAAFLLSTGLLLYRWGHLARRDKEVRKRNAGAAGPSLGKGES